MEQSLRDRLKRAVLLKGNFCELRTAGKRYASDRRQPCRDFDRHKRRTTLESRFADNEGVALVGR